MAQKQRGEGEGKYFYCVVGSEQERRFGPKGVGGRSNDVYTVCHRDIGAVVSDTPVIKYPITRENTMAHQLVMEEVMKEFTILPVRFSTIAEGRNGISPEEQIRERVLKERYEEFKSLLADMNGKVEQGLKVLWKDREAIFEEIAKKDKDVARVRKKLLSRRTTQPERMRLGELVKIALDEMRRREKNRILKRFTVASMQPLKWEENEVFGDQMILNAAFLVDTRRIEEFDRRVEQLIADETERLSCKYIGPVPPSHFVELVITWGD